MNHYTLRSMSAVFMSAALLVLPSCNSSPQAKAEHAKTASYEPGVPGGIAVETTTLTARVVSVFDSSREVVLDLPDGSRKLVKCGPEIVNFDQLHKDDMVKTTVTEEVAIAMGTESDPPDAGRATVVALAPKGGRPGGIMASTTQVTATVTSIDLANHTAMLTFPDGQTHKVVVRPDVDLAKRKVGEKVVIRKTDAFAISLVKTQG